MASLGFDVTLMILGIIVLYFGADWLVRGAVRLAGSLGVSPIVIGLTVVSFGTSAPELVVSSVAALGGNAELAIGNVLGSNLANLGLILGLTALVRPLEVHSRAVWRETPLMIVATAVLYPLAWDLGLERGDGVVLLLGLAAYLMFVLQSARDEVPEVLGEYEEFVEEAGHASGRFHPPDVLWVMLGSACLVLGGYCIVEGAVQLASALGISQVMIGLTVVAVGTSLPELATSMVAALRSESDIAVGNVIGSNIFNVAAVLGVTSTLTPVPVPASVLRRELPAVLLMSLLLFPILRTTWRIERWEGAILVGAYVAIGVFLL